ncbi:dolichyl-diphosphooligosaccharide--protein glycosyltransferase subunit DAD1-like [Olea europaea var. sylvestris]|uniref:dolichyl-diphosphooligosaccharide--protein glycosyltransferase subunit DAD1-like n=1 Tax=Olea europaea var. sylvestris TaxID=158386 RepID=UPI000C1CE220|nr:dolichyl-diphosphooligosaccharide--protein glycosyltransferase subunit DAD1-like [Olea europaea var. sylvestris]XP_022878566.1 dolichyl-diphosphooligosaccharide--protein glycosyltransferase subunit DAD1-like [Olea europaea var. sylvestris]
MGRSTPSKDAQALFHSLHSAYAATPTNLKIIDLYILFAVFTAVIQRSGLFEPRIFGVCLSLAVAGCSVFLSHMADKFRTSRSLESRLIG